MLKTGYIAMALVAAQTLLCLADPETPPPPRPRQMAPIVSAPRAWLGLRIEKPDAIVTSHVPALPAGIGFLVKAVDEGGPAQASGFKELDILWKLGDQMLVNEAQLAALLRLSKPGDEISLSGFRAGKPFESKLKLGDAPVLKVPLSGQLVESSVLPGACEGPMRLVNVAEKSASFTSDEGKAVVWREGEVFKLKIHDSKEKIIYEGDLTTDGNFAEVPQAWQRRAQVLLRTLKQMLDGNPIPQRQPRPRIVVPVAPSP